MVTIIEHKFVVNGEVLQVPDEVPLPNWTWDPTAGVLVPLCPRCGSATKVSVGYFTCYMAGFSHYHQKGDVVLELTRRRLTG